MGDCFRPTTTALQKHDNKATKAPYDYFSPFALESPDVALSPGF